jgi:hypothetical protein
VSFDITLPNINAPTEEGKNAQMRSYLYQLAEQLKYALNALDTEAANRMVQQAIKSAASAKTSDEALADFNAIKALIITSADIVEAYYEQISEKFSGLYVAKSSFPNGDEAAFIEQTQQEIVKNSTAITQNFTNVQSILSDIKGFGSETITVNACIKTGLLTYLSATEAAKYGMESGSPLYGMEVGQKNLDSDGNEVFNKYARFTADRLSFYSGNGEEIAYFSGSNLHIYSAEIDSADIKKAEIDELGLGGYLVDTSNGLAFKWKGGAT